MLTIHLGSETDDDLFERLCSEVVGMGGSIADSQWVLGGSQERTTYTINLPTGTLEAVAETYVGLSLVGDAALVHPLAKKLLGTQSSTDEPAA